MAQFMAAGDYRSKRFSGNPNFGITDLRLSLFRVYRFDEMYPNYFCVQRKKSIDTASSKSRNGYV